MSYIAVEDLKRQIEEQEERENEEREDEELSLEEDQEEEESQQEGSEEEERGREEEKIEIDGTNKGEKREEREEKKEEKKVEMPAPEKKKPAFLHKETVKDTQVCSLFSFLLFLSRSWSPCLFLTFLFLSPSLSSSITSRNHSLCHRFLSFQKSVSCTFYLTEIYLQEKKAAPKPKVKPVEAERLKYTPQTAELKEVLKPFKSSQQASLASFLGSSSKSEGKAPEKRKLEEDNEEGSLLKKPRLSLPGQ